MFLYMLWRLSDRLEEVLQGHESDEGYRITFQSNGPTKKEATDMMAGLLLSYIILKSTSKGKNRGYRSI